LAPVSAGTVVFGTFWGIGALAVSGDLAVVDQNTSLKFVDLSTPGAPTHVATLPYSGILRGLEVSDGIVYATYHDGLMEVIDARVPSLPVLKGSSVSSREHKHLDLSADALVMVESGSLVVYHRECLDGETSVGVVDDGSPPGDVRMRLAAPSPNPFNPSTEIRFELAAPGRATLEVFDLTGRRVRTLLRSELPAGPHAATWNGTDDAGRDVPAGVYVARLQVGERVEARKLALIK